MESQEIKELIIKDKELTIKSAVDVFAKVEEFLTEDMNSIRALINEAKTDLNTESVKDMHKIVFETMKAFYHLDIMVCELFTLSELEANDKIIRLYSAYESLMDYDDDYQKTLEAENEEVG
jgi:hypothetical protein